MDDFVLPSFESICILKDEDIIMIQKNCVMFHDVVQFCGSQNQEQVLQSRHISDFNNRNLSIMDPQVDSQGDENDTVLFNKSTVHIETPPSKKRNEHCKRKRSNELQGSNNTLAIKDSQGDLLGDEENVGLHGNIARKEITSNEMVNAKRKKKHSTELQTSDTLANKVSQADSKVDKGDLGLPIPHKETSSSDMIKLNRKRKHFDELQGLDDTLAIKDFQRNLQRKEEGNGPHQNTTHMEATSSEMMHAKYKRKHSNKLQPCYLTTKNSRGDSQVDEGDLWLPNGETTRKKASCEMKNAKHKGKHSNMPQGSDDTLAIKDPHGDSKGDEENVGLHGAITSLRITSNETINAKSKKNHTNIHHTPGSTLAVRDSQRDSPGDEKEVGLHNGNIAPTETPSKITNVIKRKHSIRLQSSKNESMRNDDGHVSKNDANGIARKVPSRSARRKKAKKIWHRNFRSKKEKKLIEIEIPEGDNRNKTPVYVNADQNTEVDNEIVVPAIVRLSQIHFESSDTCGMREDEPVENFQWNGTTTKKKGQKWGRENTFSKRNDDISNWLCYGESSNGTEAELVEVSNENVAVEKKEAFEESFVNHVEPVKECNENSVAKEFEAVKELIEFESFLPLIHLPEDGDVLAYRVVELSSSWCPELSPFRVGRVSSYDCNSSKIILHPLPEYPLISEEISEEGQESRTLYKEDGTLEIDFASLVDVRLFKAGESIRTSPSTTPIEEMQNVIPINNQEMQNAAPVNNQESASCSGNMIEISSNHTANNQLSEGWEAINQALNEKKSQLQKENDLDKRNSSLGTPTTGPWSYRAMRRNALGPTLAMLRSSNGDIGK